MFTDLKENAVILQNVHCVVFIFENFMFYKKVYRSVLALSASFVATSSGSCSMFANMQQNQYISNMNTMTRPRYNYMDQSCFSGPFCQNMGQISNNLNNSDCSGRFTTALMEFRNVMKCAATPGGVSFTDFPALILAQSKLIDVMSDIISSLLQSQQWQLDNGNKVRDMLTNLGNIFASCPTIGYTQEVYNKERIVNILKSSPSVTSIINAAYQFPKTTEGEAGRVKAQNDLGNALYTVYCQQGGKNPKEVLCKEIASALKTNAFQKQSGSYVFGRLITILNLAEFSNQPLLGK